ncbi:MAG TPA: cupin domain-containing protein [Nitrosomonas sp.]|nr:cupin domain-containing protein [Nitrosomonas sp.]HMY61329.1 cupin domain-containing protein [Nitrosomonas sp.]HMY89695.1 cupin domain-containing protein [Nitrosomonas sp.]HNB01929.1 cupin domain-containing protein [Nitrosomonas sp.]HNC41757.1 cupin domain-containing protein [Nitrosomonas sp.]
MKATVTELLQRMPGKVSEEWPMGEPFAVALAHGSMSVELYAPKDVDIQTPHDQDELYFIHSGKGEIVIAGSRYAFEPGTVFFVPAHIEHRFENFSADFATWVVFWGPKGGEKA